MDLILPSGLQLLLDTQHGRLYREFEALVADAMPLAKHPFSLGVTTNLPKHESCAARSKRIFLLGNPPSTESMIQSLTLTAQFLASDYEPMLPPVRYLREIRTGRLAYFEIGSTHGVYLVGGCDICTRAGNVAREQMEQLCSFLERICSVPLLDTVLNGKSTTEQVRHLNEQYQDFEHRRFEALSREA